MKRFAVTSVLLACLLAVPSVRSLGDSKEDKEAARQAKEEQAAQKKAAREADRARVLAERQQAEQDRKARRNSRFSNDSVRTQQETADSFDRQRKSERGEKEQPTTRRSPTTAPDEPAASSDDSLAEIDRKIKDEDDRHAAAMVRYRKILDSARRSANANATQDAQTALSRENETYRRNKDALTSQREALLKQASSTTDDAPPPKKKSDSRKTDKRR